MGALSENNSILLYIPSKSSILVGKYFNIDLVDLCGILPYIYLLIDAIFIWILQLLKHDGIYRDYTCFL